MDALKNAKISADATFPSKQIRLMLLRILRRREN
jgi:hypothetical protein